MGGAYANDTNLISDPYHRVRKPVKSRIKL